MARLISPNIFLATWEVCAFLNGRKSSFRRTMMAQPSVAYSAGWCITRPGHAREYTPCHEVPTAQEWAKWGEKVEPQWSVGNRVVGKEKWGWNTSHTVVYYADDPALQISWCSSAQMPGKLSRLLLEIVSVRIVRAQNISYDDICAEGFDRCCSLPGEGLNWWSQQWDAQFPRYPWASNPWLWAVGVRRV
jgi:hypothetical protein